MAKAPKKVQMKPDIELVPDAWPRFERFIKTVAKVKPQHREAVKKTRPASKGRAHKAKSRA